MGAKSPSPLTLPASKQVIGPFDGYQHGRPSQRNRSEGGFARRAQIAGAEALAPPNASSRGARGLHLSFILGAIRANGARRSAGDQFGSDRLTPANATDRPRNSPASFPFGADGWRDRPFMTIVHPRNAACKPDADGANYETLNSAAMLAQTLSIE